MHGALFVTTLQGLNFLYRKGLPILGHIQTGNIFVVDDVCRLGGYENTLLGYRTRLYRLCKDHPHEHFDIILFGSVRMHNYTNTQCRVVPLISRTGDKLTN